MHGGMGGSGGVGEYMGDGGSGEKMHFQGGICVKKSKGCFVFFVFVFLFFLWGGGVLFPFLLEQTLFLIRLWCAAGKQTGIS